MAPSERCYLARGELFFICCPWHEQMRPRDGDAGGLEGGGGEGGTVGTVLRRNSTLEPPPTPLPSHPNTAQTDPRRPPEQRSCCLCCWRCCKCNSYSSKRHEDKNTDSILLELSRESSCSPPSLVEVRSWGDSFDKLMSCPVGRKVFKEFLRCEYSEENILFYLACEDLKKEREPSLVEEKARMIYEDFISILSPREVSLDSRVREIVNVKMRSPDASTFDEAQIQIYTLMHRDSYPRFVASAVYKRLAQLTSDSRKSSAAAS